MRKKSQTPGKIVNRRARFDYALGDSLVVGLELTGAEAKSLRLGHAQLRGAYVTERNDELYLVNAQIISSKGVPIAEDQQTRSRKLLAKRKEIDSLAAARQQGNTIVPLELLTKGRYVKLKIAVGRGKKRYDKRETIKRRQQEKRSEKVTMIKIYSWNVNGIRAVVRKGELQKFMAKHQPDILCLQETKAEQGQAEIEFDGYEELWNSAEKKGYSGTAIFTKIKPINVQNGFPQDFVDKYKLHGDVYGDPNKEGRVITAEFDKFFVVGVYTINVKDDLSRLDIRQVWDKAFIGWCQDLEKTKPVIFCGDLNVAHTEDDLARSKENVGRRGFTDQERAGFQKLVDHGFVDTFREFKQGNGHYTWWTHWANARARNVGWRIDYFLISETLRKNLKNAEIHAGVMGSDHCPISIQLDM